MMTIIGGGCDDNEWQAALLHHGHAWSSKYGVQCSKQENVLDLNPFECKVLRALRMKKENSYHQSSSTQKIVVSVAQTKGL